MLQTLQTCLRNLERELIPYLIASAFVSSILAHPMLPKKKGKEKKTKKNAR